MLPWMPAGGGQGPRKSSGLSVPGIVERQRRGKTAIDSSWHMTWFDGYGYCYFIPNTFRYSANLWQRLFFGSTEEIQRPKPSDRPIGLDEFLKLYDSATSRLLLDPIHLITPIHHKHGVYVVQNTKYKILI
jgi:hypothetical protein